MDDMADIDEVEEAWEAIGADTDISRVIPITYMNSSAAITAFVGRNGGSVCTSTNARAVLDWALGKGERAGRNALGSQVGCDTALFLTAPHHGDHPGGQMG